MYLDDNIIQHIVIDILKRYRKILLKLGVVVHAYNNPGAWVMEVGESLGLTCHLSLSSPVNEADSRADSV